MAKRYKKRRKANQSDWQQLKETPALRSAYVQFATAVQQAQDLAQIRAPHAGLPAAQIIDLRDAGRILDTHPQLVTYLESIRERQLAERSARDLPMDMLTRASPTGSTAHIEPIGGWGTGYNDRNQAQGVSNVRMLRDWSENSEWVNAAINYYCERVARADIAVIPYDETGSYNRAVEKSVQLLLDQPNEFGDTWPSLIKMGLKDYFALGRFIWSKGMNAKRQPMSLYAEDAATIKVYANWDANPDTPRYLYDPDGTGRTKIPLRNDEIIYIPDGISTYRLSFSRVQALRNTIISDLKATESAARLVDMKPPPHVIQIPGATPAQIKTLRATYEAEIMGRREVLWLGGEGTAQVKPMVFSLKDNQWMEWLEYLARKICAIFQISPQDIGLTYDINKATAGSQQDISENKGLIPLLLLIEEYMNRHVLADFAPRLPGGRTNIDALNLRIVFPEISEAARQMHAEKSVDMATKSLAGLPSMTINQCLAIRGELPVPHGNTFYVNTSNGPIPWLSYDEKIDYTPSLSGGQQGSQDPESGPNANEEADGDIGTNDSGDNEESSPSDASNSGSDSAGSPDLSQGNGNGDASSTEKRFSEGWYRAKDYRRPGTRWSPAATLRRAQPSPPPSIHSEDQQARAQLAATIEKVFGDAKKRGEEKLRGMI